MDGIGNGIVVWQQDYQEPDWSSRITANYFTPTGGWGTARPIEDSLSYSLEPHVAMNDNGTAMVVWLGSAYGTEPVSGIWSLRYTPTDGWEPEPVLIEALGDFSTSDSHPQVAVDPLDDALVVWRAYGTNEDHIWSSHYTPDEGWDTSVILSFSGLSGQNPGLVRGVQLSVLTRTIDEDPQITGSGRQGVANRNPSGAPDAYRRRLVTLAVAPRNLLQ